MIQTKNLSYTYDSSEALNFPDIECKQGETLLLLGESGKGKTTMLHLLAQLLPLQSGEIIIDNVPISKLKENQKSQFRGQKIGMIFQKNNFINSLSVLENIVSANYFASNKLNFRLAKALSEQLGIGKLLNKSIFELSGGEQQRVGIARALMNQPKVILADEPTSSLDDSNAIKVFHLLERQAKEINAALIIVTHDKRLKDLVNKQITL